MTEYDQIISEQLLAERCQIILHGHEHRPRINKSSGVYGDSVTIPAGALYTCRVPGDPRHRNSYNFGSFDIPSYTGKVHYRVWNEEWDRWSADERFWKGGKASFLLSNVSDEREKGAREELFELQKQFSPYIKKRIANSMTIDFQHSPIEVGGRRFLNMEIGHNIEIESGPNEVFPIVTKSNKRIIRSPIPEVRERKLELISLTPDYREVRPLDCAKSDDSEQRYEVDIGRETTEILYKYKVLETNEGVWKFTLGRFARSVKIRFRLSPEHFYEFTSLGGFPGPTPIMDNFLQLDTMETRNMALPLQGYLVQWYPRDG
jgi:hypothetical protein